MASGRPTRTTPGAARTAAHTFESRHWENPTPDFRNTPSRVDGVVNAIKDGAANALVTAAEKSTDLKESAKRGIWRAGTVLACAAVFSGVALFEAVDRRRR